MIQAVHVSECSERSVGGYLTVFFTHIHYSPPLLLASTGKKGSHFGKHIFKKATNTVPLLQLKACRH